MANNRKKTEQNIKHPPNEIKILVQKTMEVFLYYIKCKKARTTLTTTKNMQFSQFFQNKIICYDR